MREALAVRKEERTTFTGTFERLGTKRGWEGREEQTLLLKDVCDVTGKRICDHLWFHYTKAFRSLDLQAGETVQFDARVKAYRKGYCGRRDDVDKPVEVDYKLSHPTRVQKVRIPQAYDDGTLPLFVAKQEEPCTAG